MGSEQSRAEGGAGGEREKTQALAAELVAKVRSGKLDPRKASLALGLRYDQDEIMAILELAALAQPRQQVDREAVARIVDREALDRYDRAYRGCIENGHPEHLARHYADTEYGAARTDALAKADAILAMLGAG